MKQKFSKKLVLNKTTVSDLTSKHMNDVRGGMSLTDPRYCNTTEEYCSIYYTRYYTCNDGCNSDC